MSKAVIPRLFGGVFNAVFDDSTPHLNTGYTKVRNTGQSRLQLKSMSIEELIMGVRVLRLICLLRKSGREISGVHNGVELMIRLIEQDRNSFIANATREQSRQLAAEASETLLTLCLDSNMNSRVRRVYEIRMKLISVCSSSKASDYTSILTLSPLTGVSEKIRCRTTIASLFGYEFTTE